MGEGVCNFAKEITVINTETPTLAHTNGCEITLSKGDNEIVSKKVIKA